MFRRKPKYPGPSRPMPNDDKTLCSVIVAPGRLCAHIGTWHVLVPYTTDVPHQTVATLCDDHLPTAQPRYTDCHPFDPGPCADPTTTWFPSQGGQPGFCDDPDEQEALHHELINLTQGVTT